MSISAFFRLPLGCKNICIGWQVYTQKQKDSISFITLRRSGEATNYWISTDGIVFQVDLTAAHSSSDDEWTYVRRVIFNRATKYSRCPKVKNEDDENGVVGKLMEAIYWKSCFKRARVCSFGRKRSILGCKYFGRKKLENGIPKTDRQTAARRAVTLTLKVM